MKNPEEIHNVSNTQLSISRHYGGIIYNGKEYVYFPDEDKLVRKDLLNKKKPKKIDKQKKIDNNGKLF